MGERAFVRDARSVRVRDGRAQSGSALFDLVARPVDEDDLDVERAQHREIQQHVGKILGLDNLAVQREDEDAVAEAWDILENAPEVGNLHGKKVRVGGRAT